jgi:hypothetical protein
MFNPQAVSQRVDAFRGNPQALVQKYAVSQELLDLLALQQITKEKQDAARQMQLQMAQQQGQQPPPVSQQLESEAMQLTQQQLTQKLAPTAQAQAQEQAQAQQNPQPAQPPQAQAQGIAANPAPNMAFAEGGIVGYAKGGDAGLETQRAGDQAALRRLATLARDAGVDLRDALLDVTTAPLRAAAGIADSTVVRLARALGSDVGYMSSTFVPKGADASSLTPYADITRAARGESAGMDTGSWGAEARLGRTRPEQPAAPETPEAPPTPDLTNLGGAGANTTSSFERARFNPPPEDPLAKRYREGIGALMDAKPDYSGAEQYESQIAGPMKGIQDERRAALEQRQQQAAALRAQQLAATEDNTPGWLNYLQHASANIGEGRNAGLRALSAGAVSQRKERQSTAEKRAEIEAKYMAVVNQLEDAGFSTKEAKLKADEIVLGKRGEADTAAAAQRQAGLGEAGTEVRDTRARETQIAIARMQEEGRRLSEKAASGRATQTEQRELRQLLADLAREYGKELETDPIKVRMMTPEQRYKNDRIKADLEAVRQQQMKLGGVPTSTTSGGSGTRMRFDAKGNPIP